MFAGIYVRYFIPSIASQDIIVLVPKGFAKLFLPFIYTLVLFYEVTNKVKLQFIDMTFQNIFDIPMVLSLPVTQH